MLIEQMQQILPKDWQPMDLYNERFKIITVPPFSTEYQDIECKILGNYYSHINGIYKLQNPHLYTKFALKSYEYYQRGPYEVLGLFHDTPSENVESIAMYNVDWRYGERFKYGPGVYFSVSPTLAHKHSHKKKELCRSMFLVDVLVQNVQVNDHVFLPDYGYDTVLAHNNSTFVKYFDCEYYPRYFVDYVSAI